MKAPWHGLAGIAAAALALLGGTTIAANPARAADASIFSIGTADGSDSEFALAPGSFAQYPSTFPNDTTYTVGTSTPDKDWPYIQPGPNDAWAGGKQHTFTINYSLPQAPGGDLLLKLSYLDTQEAGPPQVQVSSNGTAVKTLALPAGGGGGVTGTDPMKPYEADVIIPASAVHDGANTLTIANTANSWSVYDAVELTAAPTGPPQVTISKATPTPLFVADHGDKQLVDVDIANTGGRGPVTFTATANGQTATTTTTVDYGAGKPRIEVPPAPESGPVQLTISAGDGPDFSTQLPYQRRWQLDIIHGSHQDIGYDAAQPVIRTEQDNFLDTAVKACQATAGNPDNAKFRWTVEHAWQLENYVKDRSVPQVAALGKCMQSDQIELQGTYDNDLYDLNNPEQMTRQLYEGTREFPEKFGVPVHTAIQDDVTGVTEQEIQLMAKAGIKLLLNGSNVGHTEREQKTSTLYWAKAPDGSKLLTFFAADAYPEAYNFYKLTGPGTDAGVDALAGSMLTSPLAKLQASGYPQSVYPLMMFNDNWAPVTTLPDLVQKFDQRYSWPKLEMSTPTRYYQDAVAQGTSKLPVVSGDYTGWWSDGAGSSAFETGEAEQAQTRTTGAETLGALATVEMPDPQRQSDVDSSYQNGELYSEHTWGSAILNYNDPEWPFKKEFADNADKSSKKAMTSAVGQFAGQIGNHTPWPEIAVLNPLSWQRGDIVQATVHTGQIGGGQFRMMDGTRTVPYEIVSRSNDKVTLRFLADGVPATGYKTYQLVPGNNVSGSDPALAATKSGLENAYYKVHLDPATGAIDSIVDRQTGRELVDAKSAFQLNQYVYRPNCAKADHNPPCQTSDAHQWSPSNPTIDVVSNGPVTATIRITYSGGAGGATSGVNSISTLLSLSANTRRLDITDSIDKVRVDTPEEGYFAFPFDQDHPDVTYEVPGAPVRFFTDQTPGAALDWQSMRSYVDVSGRSDGITLSSTDAPLIELDHIRSQEFQARPGRLDGTSGPVDPGKYLPTNGSVFSYAFNNLWDTNYRMAQAGPISFHYSITDHTGGFDPVAATHYGWGVQNPLQPAELPAGQAGDRPSGARSLLSVSKPNVVLQTVKPAYQGQPGYTVRLLEIAGKAGNVTLRMPFKVGSASLADPVERPTTSLQTSGSDVQVPVSAHGIVTVEVRPEVAVAVSAERPEVTRGGSVAVTVSVRNSTARIQSGSLTLAGPLSISPASRTYASLAPGKTATATFQVSASTAARVGAVSLTARATAVGAEVQPVGLPLTVQNPVDVQINPHPVDLVAGKPSNFQVTVT
ncbi:MAG TPA: polysaccharide lyase family protein, partial [Mycobacteriales bacterium]|nr:polysaccharide lyase family protein [Mycobacteriales bacterium]